MDFIAPVKYFGKYLFSERESQTDAPRRARSTSNIIP